MTVEFILWAMVIVIGSCGLALTAAFVIHLNKQEEIEHEQPKNDRCDRRGCTYVRVCDHAKSDAERQAEATRCCGRKL